MVFSLVGFILCSWVGSCVSCNDNGLEHPQQMCQMCQMPNILYIWHTKHKNGALSDALNMSNFCNMLKYHCILTRHGLKWHLYFIIFLLFIFLSHPTQPLHLHFPGYCFLSSPLCLIVLSLVKDGFRCGYILAWASAWVR